MRQTEIEKFTHPELGGRGRRVSRQELLSELRRVGSLLGRAPTRREFEKYSSLSGTPYHNEFGSWSAAVEETGYEPNEKDSQHVLEPSVIIDGLQSIAEQKQGVPSQRDVEDHDTLTLSAIEHQFSTWGEALQEAGFDVDANGRVRVFTKYEPHELVEEMVRVAGIVGRPPTKEDMREEGELTHKPFVTYFGSWPSAQRSCGFPPRYRSDPETQPASYNYGTNWEEKRHEALTRDRHRCQHCGLKEQEHREKFGASLDVHHIYPIREFSAPEDANFLENLITLCRSCHAEWEHLTPSELPEDWPAELNPDDQTQP